MPVKILMVCLGNICRSPLAEGVLASKLPKNNFIVDSAGTGSWHIGHAPDKRSIAVALKNGVDLTNQKGRQFQIADFDTFDYIYVMDKSNYKDVITLAKTEAHKKKVQLILNELLPDLDTEVPDPYFGETDGFDRVYQMLDQATDLIAAKLIKKHS